MSLAEGTGRSFRHAVETTASRERIWNLWLDVAAWPEWDDELAESKLLGPLEVGSPGLLRPRSGPTSRFVIRRLEHLDGYSFETKLPLGSLLVERFFEGSTTATRFVHRVSFRGASSFIFGAVLGGRFRRALPRVMQQLVRLAERDT